MNWKAYEEVNFSDQYILRWVREGDEYVSRITKEMMEDFKAVVSQQQAQLDAAEQQVLDAFERGKMFGYAQGLRKAQEK